MGDNIQTTDWLIKDISKVQLQTEKVLALISYKINIVRRSLKMEQKEFAKHMGVKHDLVLKWESGKHNFTVSDLIFICNKLNISLNISLLSDEET